MVLAGALWYFAGAFEERATGTRKWIHRCGFFVARTTGQRHSRDGQNGKSKSKFTHAATIHLSQCNGLQVVG
jgi:hypothetical protein